MSNKRNDTFKLGLPVEVIIQTKIIMNTKNWIDQSENSNGSDVCIN